MTKLKELEEEISILNKMLVSLVDLLEKRSILTHEEWEAEVRKKLKESGSLTKFRDLGD
jgi:hypothetical protein